MSFASAVPTADPGPLHAIDARAKLIALVGLVVVTVSVPAINHVGLAGCAALVGLLALAGRIRPGDLLHRLLHLAPFLAVAAILPFSDPDSGIQQACGEVAKAVIGCLALVLLAATTRTDELLAGLSGLRCPAVIVQILAMLLRYLHLLRSEASRLRQAAVARGYAPRSLAQVAAIGHLLGALFLRSHARAERVHAAMLARGFDGRPAGDPPAAMLLADHAFIVLVLGCALTWRILGP